MSMPFVAVQIFTRASSIRSPGLSAAAYFKMLQERIPGIAVRKTEESESRVVFTARQQRREIRVIVSNVAGEEQPTTGDILYLNFSGARPVWHYAAKRQGV